MIRYWLAGALLCVVASAAEAQPIALVGGRVLTEGPEGDLPTGTVIIDSGRIIAVGRDVPVPAGAKIIDASGKIVTPGFINAASDVGLSDLSTTEPGNGGSNPAGNEIYRAFNPRNAMVKENLTDGATAAILVPYLNPQSVAQGNLFGGGAAAVDMSGSFDSLIQADIGNIVSVRSAAAAGGREAFFPKLVQQIRQAKGTGMQSLAKPGAALSVPPAARSIPGLERIVKGEAPLIVEVQRASDIVQVLDIARDEKIDVILLGAAEGWLVADRIAQAGAKVVLQPDANSPSDFESLYSTYQNAARLVKAGVEVAFIGEAMLIPVPRGTRSPRFIAGRAVAYGLDYRAALKAITAAPAHIYKVDSQIGSIEVGKRADITIWSGDPLEVTSFVEHVFVKGVEQSLDSRTSLLRDKYQKLLDGAN